MNLSVYKYMHSRDWWKLWAIYNDSIVWLLKEKPDTSLINVLMPSGEMKVCSHTEYKLLTSLEKGSEVKYVENNFDGQVIGYVQYVYNYDIITIESLYILRDYRGKGITRLFLATFPGVKKIRFEVDTKNRPLTMLEGLNGATYKGPSDKGDHLEMWEAEVRYVSIDNPQMTEKVRLELQQGGLTSNGN